MEKVTGKVEEAGKRCTSVLWYQFDTRGVRPYIKVTDKDTF
jgi:hypothetical protein